MKRSYFLIGIVRQSIFRLYATNGIILARKQLDYILLFLLSNNGIVLECSITIIMDIHKQNWLIDFSGNVKQYANYIPLFYIQYPCHMSITNNDTIHKSNYMPYYIKNIYIIHKWNTMPYIHELYLYNP